LTPGGNPTSKYTRRFGTPIFFASFTVFSAFCSDAKKGPDSLALGADSLNKDLRSRDATDVAAAAQGRSAAEAPGQEEALARRRRAPTRPAQPNDSARHDDHASGNTVTMNRKPAMRRKRWRCSRHDSGWRDDQYELVEGLHRHERGWRSRDGDGPERRDGLERRDDSGRRDGQLTVTALKRSENPTIRL
jgi:hypothetical protein